MKILIFTFMILFNQFAFSQIDRKGNGGNEIALDFLNSAKRVLSIYGGELKTFPQLKGINLGKILEETNVLVSSTPLSVKFSGIKQEVTAVNFKNPFTILVNEKRWLAIKKDAIKEALALHELLGLVEIEKTGVYFISKNYLAKNGIHCTDGLCESKKGIGEEETFCRFQNNWYSNEKTYKYRFACQNKKFEFTIYCDLWKDPVEFDGNKIDALGGTWVAKDEKGGVLSYAYPDQGGVRCTYEDVKDK